MVNDASAKFERCRAVAALDRVNAVSRISARIVVDPGDRPTAWSWADGTIYVSRGFIQRTSDEELAAVVAHELGHLCLAGDGTAAVRFGFRGDGSVVVEHQADEIAVGLLKRSGLPANSLARALGIVRDAPQTTPAVRQALDARINLLHEND